MKKSKKIPNDANQLVITVHVVPRASRSEIVGEHNGALRVRIAAPPVDGLANEELVRLLAKTFNVSKREVLIVGGHTGKIKQVRINRVKASYPQITQITQISKPNSDS